LIFSRVWQGLLVLILLSFLCFALFPLAPGDVMTELRLDPDASPATIESLRRQRGLDRPFWTSYAEWLKSALRGDWGASIAYQRPVSEIVGPRAGRTLLLNWTALAIAWMVSLPLAYLRARRPGGAGSRAGATAVYALVAAPDLMIALAALWLAMHTGWFRTGGSYPLCVLCLTLLLLAPIFRHAEAAFREALRQPYVWNATAAGVRGIALARYWILPTAAGPLLALFGLQLSGAFSASLVVETVLSWPGLGPLLLESVLNRDYPVITAAVLLTATTLLLSNLAADLLQRALDPRLRRGR
jgi:peptide/nickel transport system permease protein